MIAAESIEETRPLAAPALIGLGQYKMKILQGWLRRWVLLRVNMRLVILAVACYRDISRVRKVLLQLHTMRRLTMGPGKLKLIRINGKYYHHLYAPAFPSKVFDEYILGEFNRIYPVKKKTNLLTFLFLAITKKCPLRCEHCFEWDNLNKKETLQVQDLQKLVSVFQHSGLSQFHLSGGEPLTRIRDLQLLISEASKKTEFYVLTSGFHFTAANASLLKRAGLTGVVISLDHFDSEKHDAFRGFPDSFSQATQAIHHAQEQNLVVAITLCITRSFISWHNLLQYAEFAKQMKVAFVQLLEPKPVGHYKNMDVALSSNQLRTVDHFFEKMNSDFRYRDYPIIIYHGYHQRRIGCLSGGNRALYIDTEGYINACPFCQTKNANIREVLESGDKFESLVKSSKCPAENSLQLKQEI